MTISSPLASDVDTQRIAAPYGRLMMGLWIMSVTKEQVEDENRIAFLLSQLAFMGQTRGDNIMEVNVTKSRAMMDDVM